MIADPRDGKTATKDASMDPHDNDQSNDCDAESHVEVVPDTLDEPNGGKGRLVKTFNNGMYLVYRTRNGVESTVLGRSPKRPLKNKLPKMNTGPGTRSTTSKDMNKGKGKTNSKGKAKGKGVDKGKVKRNAKGKGKCNGEMSKMKTSGVSTGKAL